ncbi:hypothetical protein WMY93_012637 [Mugilogobius chulae]|uniref:ubiquitinyl hydrolase 1 n=1 Tax=Mugilogobius chulae TaxID=88201 RepID=A0AAW0NXM7_9GOBI
MKKENKSKRPKEREKREARERKKERKKEERKRERERERERETKRKHKFYSKTQLWRQNIPGVFPDNTSGLSCFLDLHGCKCETHQAPVTTGSSDMKPKALSIRECAWTSEECHFSDDGSSQSNALCLPNIFRPKRIKPMSKTPNGPTYQIYYTARELFTEVLDRGAIRELTRRATSAKSGSNRTTYNPSKDHNVDLSTEGEYMDALTWFSVVLKSGIFVDEKHNSDLTLDGWQGVLKRNSFQTNLMSLTRLEDVAKLETLSAFCSHLSRRYQALYTPGHNLTIKKYQLSYQQEPSSLHLALLCDVSTGFICNMFLYCPEQMQKQSRKPVIQKVISHLLRPFCSNSHVVKINSSAWMDGKLTDSTTPRKQQQTNQESKMAAHLQGWTGPALFRPSDLRGSEVDVFLPGLWVALHVVCVNTFVLHSLQNQGSAKRAELTEFTKALGSQLVVDPVVAVPALPRLHSSYQDGPFTEPTNHRRGSMDCRLSSKARGEARRCATPTSLHLPPACCGTAQEGVWCNSNSNASWGTVRSQDRWSARFVRLLEQMWLGRRASRCAAAEARTVLCSVLPQFNNHLQQDAQELLMYSLNALHDDLNKDCLSLFFEQSVLTGGEQMLCSECGLRRETAVVTYIDKAPDILILHLKRFGCKGKSQVKLKTNVEFSTDDLDLSPFLSSSVHSSSSCSYRLYAVVNHIGHLHMGHYTALCFNTVTQTWHCFDDSVVRPVESAMVQSPHAYILLYSRKPFRKPQIQGL